MRIRLSSIFLTGITRLHFKSMLIQVASLMAFLLSTLPAVAAPQNPARITTITIGGDRDYPPYEFLDKDGQPSGYNVELTHAIANVMGMTVRFQLGGWSEMREALQSGKIDVLQGMSYSDERALEVDFSLPHAVVNHAVFARKDSPNVNSLAELEGKSVAVHRSGIMHDYLVRSGFRGRLILTDTPADALRQLAAGSAEIGRASCRERVCVPV